MQDLAHIVAHWGWAPNHTNVDPPDTIDQSKRGHTAVSEQEPRWMPMIAQVKQRKLKRIETCGCSFHDTRHRKVAAQSMCADTIQFKLLALHRRF
jgi:hypothetical protein